MVLLVLLLQSIGRIRRSVSGLLDVAGKVGANTANIPQLEATAPVLALIVDEAVVQDGYMNALTDGYGPVMSSDTLTVLTVVLAVVVIAVLAVALILIRRGLAEISEGLGTLHSALEGVESQHLRPLEGAVKAINAQFDVDPRRAAGHRPQGRGRRRAEAALMLWVAAIVLLVVVVPVVVVLLNGVLQAAQQHRARRSRGSRRWRPPAPRTSTPSRCCSPRSRRSSRPWPGSPTTAARST